jgi:hypothetical protein
MNMAEQQWERWLSKALEATARAWEGGKAMPSAASEMFHDFDTAWDLLVRGDSEGAAQLTAPWGYSADAIRNQARILASERNKGYVPPKGSDFIKATILDYTKKHKEASKASQERGAGEKALSKEIEALVGYSPIIGSPPSSDSNTVVTSIYQPLKVDVLDPEITEEDLATLMTWVEKNHRFWSRFYYSPNHAPHPALAFSNSSPRTARRTGWDN